MCLTWCRGLTGADDRLIRGLGDVWPDLEGAAALLPITVQGNHHNVKVGLSVGAQYHTCHPTYLCYVAGLHLGGGGTLAPLDFHD